MIAKPSSAGKITGEKMLASVNHRNSSLNLGVHCGNVFFPIHTSYVHAGISLAALLYSDNLFP